MILVSGLLFIMGVGNCNGCLRFLRVFINRLLFLSGFSSAPPFTIGRARFPVAIVKVSGYFESFLAEEMVIELN